MRSRLICLFPLTLLATSQTARAQDDSEMRAKQGAYHLAIQCFVAEGVAVGFDRQVGDQSRADSLEKRARVSFDTATALGTQLGYSGSKISQDIGLMQGAETVKYAKDIGSLRGEIATCEGAGI